MSMTPAASEYFEKVATEWDTLRAGFFPEAVREAAITRAYLRPEMVVADVGTGTGFAAAGLAPRVRQVYALDGSAEMLEVARRNLAGFANVVYQVGDGQALPLEDGSVDAVFANMYLHHCPDPAVAIAEMVRILKPGGRLMLTDLDTHSHEWMRREMADEWLGFDRAQVRAWLREAGLVNIIADCTGNACCAERADPVDVDPEDRHTQISVFMATGTRRVEARADVRAGYGALAAGERCGCATPAAAPEAAAGQPQGCCAPGATPEAAAGQPQSCCAPGATPEAAAGQPQSCCAPAAVPEATPRTAEESVQFATGYTAQQLAGVPQEAADFSLGCGNPVLLAALQPGETVLDIGSGGGIDCFYAARQVGPAGRVIGLDMTPEMIARAQASARRAGLENVSFRLGQAEAMPIDAGTVDVVLSNCVINLSEDKGQVFAEAYRVMKPGGRLVVSDMVTDGPLPLALRNQPDQWASCVVGALPEQEYVDLVRQAGFRGVEVRRSSVGGTIEGVRVYSALVTAQRVLDP